MLTAHHYGTQCPRYFLHVEGPSRLDPSHIYESYKVPKQLVCDFIILDEHLTRLFSGRRAGDLDTAVYWELTVRWAMTVKSSG